jgi:hypothetical protein
LAVRSRGSASRAWLALDFAFARRQVIATASARLSRAASGGCWDGRRNPADVRIDLCWPGGQCRSGWRSTDYV